MATEKNSKYRGFIKRVAELSEDDIYDEYREVRKSTEQANPKVAFATGDKNSDLNRYTDVQCLDSSRVKLNNYVEKSKLGKMGLTGRNNFNNYIHANHVSGFDSSGKFCENTFIAAQGPTDETVTHFWEMIVQQNVTSIVCLTNMVERGRRKCHPYVPFEKNEKMTFPEDDEDQEFADSKTTAIVVEKVEEICHEKVMADDDFVISKIKIQFKRDNKTLTRYVNHCFYRTWPDHGIPDGDEQVMIKFIEKVKELDLQLEESRKTNEIDKDFDYLKITQSPIVVHCSAGIGRTGTYILIDQAIHNYTKQVDQNEAVTEKNHLTTMDKDFIVNLATKIRQQRNMAIQTQDQYRYCYNAVRKYIESQDGTAQANDTKPHEISKPSVINQVPFNGDD